MTFRTLFTLTLISAACASGAQEVGRVISTQPIIQQVATPRQVCADHQVEVIPQKSGAGAAMGAVAGGAIGNAVGRGAGNAAATVIGVLGGAVLGDRIEGPSAPQLQTVRNCSTQNFYENRTVAFNVVYEYAGRQYSVQMPNDPGPTVQLQVTPMGANAQSPAYPVQAPMVQQTYVPAPVIESRVIYQPYYPRPYYVPPVHLNFGYGYWGHHHWR
jgi:uncharacterized protein YcfJ